MFYDSLRFFSGRLALLFVCTTSLGACADNSFLELSLALPGRIEMRQHAVVRVLPGGGDSVFDFDRSWRGLEKNFVLLPQGQEQAVSVESLREEVDLGVRVEFCATEFCAGVQEPSPAEAWFVIRRPFVIGARTRLRIEIPALPVGLPEEPLEIDCRGGACVEAGAMMLDATVDAALDSVDAAADATSRGMDASSSGDAASLGADSGI